MSEKHIGEVVQVTGPVLDIRFPEGELPASVNTLANEDLPLFTPRNQILLSNPVNNNNDNPRIFLKSILKPLKGLEAVFEYTFDKNIYDYHWYTGQYDYTTIQGGSSKSFVDDYLRKYKQHTNYTLSTFTLHIVRNSVTIISK